MEIKKGDQFYIKCKSVGGDHRMDGPYICTLAELGFVYHEHDDESGRRLEYCNYAERCVKMESKK